MSSHQCTCDCTYFLSNKCLTEQNSRACGVAGSGSTFTPTPWAFLTNTFPLLRSRWVTLRFWLEDRGSTPMGRKG